MWENFNGALEIIDKHGYPVAGCIVLGFMLYKVSLLWLSENEENKENMRRQIDELAAENRV